MNASAFQIFVVKKHPVTRLGVYAIFDAEDDFDICREASSAEEAPSLTEHANPKLVLHDLRHEGRNRVELLKDIKVI